MKLYHYNGDRAMFDSLANALRALPAITKNAQEFKEALEETAEAIEQLQALLEMWKHIILKMADGLEDEDAERQATMVAGKIASLFTDAERDLLRDGESDGGKD